ncbi:MAG: M28 family metallopeptidase [Acidobacteria bacterium]|nr:M28 family metallopeptidase [Acidobacteriota bacterium]
MRLKPFALVLLALGAPPAPAGDVPAGFFASSREAEARAERAFLATPSADKARRWLQTLTEEPHVAGTPQEKALAEYVRDRFREMGLEADIVRYDVFLNHPKSVTARLVEPVEEELALREEPIPGDKDSTRRGMFPAFHGYGASGGAEGQVVYANYGTPADFEKLQSLGVPVQGRIVLARYGRVFRGLKVKEAQERGASGILIYSDPADDGYMKGDVYPDGPMRPPSAIQRGSVRFNSYAAGDPSTPGWASTPGAKRVPRDEMDSVPRIPSLPLSYAEAEKILRRLGGVRVPDDWQGGLPFAYHVGPGAAAVAMDVQMDEGLKPIFNVIARIPGTEAPEQLVILGNHRDAWTHGAVDPSSGTASMLEAARGLAAALATGWRPRRTILLASWDAEEYGLVGSTEWAEDRAAELTAHAVAYVNLDSSVTGPDLDVGGVPSLRDLVREAARDVPEPKKGGSVGEAWERRERAEWARESPIELHGPEPTFELQVDPLGSGSDYTAFLDHLGVPSLNFGFDGPYGVYHSVFDNFRWMERFGDPEFLYHAAAARLYGLLAMRLASADVVPLRFGSYATALRQSLDALRRDVLRKARTPAEPDGKESRPLVPDFGPVLAALERLGAAGAAADRAVERLVAAERRDLAAQANAALLQVERAFVSPDGLPGRPWFRHVLYAPGTTTGYAAWPFPGLRQAVEDRDPALFAAESAKVVTALDAAAERLSAVARLAP